MKRPNRPYTLLLTLLILLTLVGPGAAAPVQAAPRQGIGELYLALGDSLGVGLLASSSETRGYVGQFHALLEQRTGRAVALRNVSVSGETTRSLIVGGQLLAAQQAIREARDKNWRISPITIDIGGNDILALRNSDDRTRENGLTEFRTNLGRIFDTLLTATTQNGVRTADILTMSIYNPYGGDPQVARSDAWWVERFNTVLTEEANKREIPIAKVYERFKGKEKELTWVPLDFHANNRGHRAIAEEFWAISGYDAVAPTAELVEPTGGKVARAVPTIKVKASDDIAVTRVELQIDNQPGPTPVYAASLGLWIGYWDARNAAPGQHKLAVIVSDAAGNQTRREVTVTR